MQHSELQAQAQQLRDRGLSTRKIAAQLGVSQPWVTRHTTAATAKSAKSVSSSKREIAIAETLAKATSPQGCNTKEFNDIIKAVYGVVRDEDTGRYGVDCSSEEKKAIKRRVKDLAARDGKAALFFEDFISRETPTASLQLMLTLAQGVHEAVVLAVAEFQEAYPDASTYAVQQALQGMAIPGYRPESVEAYCERAATAAHALQQVAPAAEAVEAVEAVEIVTEHTEHTDEFLADLADIEGEMFGSAEAPAATLPAITHDEYREDVPAPEVEEGADTEVCLDEVSLDDLDDDESEINFDAVDDHWTQVEYRDDMAIDEHYEHDETTAQAIRDLFKQRADERLERAKGKRPNEWALRQQEEDAFYEMLADAESHNTNFIF